MSIPGLYDPLTCTCSYNKPTSEPKNALMLPRSSWSFYSVIKNMMSTELHKSIKTRLISRLSYYTIMTIGSLSLGYTLMVSLLEKMTMAHGPLYADLERPRGITFTVSTCLAYFLWKELELPSSRKPHAMVLTIKLGYLLVIFRKK